MITKDQHARLPMHQPGPPLSFRFVQPHEIEQVKREVQAALFGGDRATIDANFLDHENGASTTILGYEAGRLIGIVTIRWYSHYPPFRARQIPLIQNIEIRYEDRGRGLGNKLLERAEREIAGRSGLAGLCVGIFADYGPAQRLYARRGFVPDGRGVCRKHTPLQQGEQITVEHDLLLWLIKDVSHLSDQATRAFET